MSYAEFLGQWYNVAFLLLGLSGAGLWIAGRLRRRRAGRGDGVASSLVAGTLVASGVAGLTVNGAIHDLSLGDPAPRFPLVLPAALAVGFVVARAYRKLARRYFPPVHGVEIDSPDLAGLDARIVSKNVSGEPRSGRAQLQAGDVLHLVHCHAENDGVRFGRTVRLVEFDSTSGSYLVVTSPPA